MSASDRIKKAIADKKAEVDQYDDFFDSDKAAKCISELWRGLGDRISTDTLNHSGDPAEAVRWATCAEACYWKATGEADSHDVKDVLPRPQERADG